MNSISLRRKKPDLRKVEIKNRFPGELAEELDLYREMYSEKYSEEISREELVEELVRQFLAHDKVFGRKIAERRIAIAREP